MQGGFMLYKSRISNISSVGILGSMYGIDARRVHVVGVKNIEYQVRRIQIRHQNARAEK